jgi:hypothetical protein
MNTDDNKPTTPALTNAYIALVTEDERARS